MAYTEPTPFEDIYDAFLGKVTDDMYMSQDSDGIGPWTKEDTLKDLKQILLDSIPGFEFPRFPLYDYDAEAEEYNVTLTKEEINIFALLMLETWVQRQMTSIENTRQKYTGSDFKATSQANHLSKLMELKRETERRIHHMQRLYKRRKQMDEEGTIKSNWSILRETSTFDGQV